MHKEQLARKLKTPALKCEEHVCVWYLTIFISLYPPSLISHIAFRLHVKARVESVRHALQWLASDSERIILLV